MSNREFASLLRQSRLRLEAELPGSLAETALTGLSIVKDRSINEGILVDSKPGNKADYSTNKVGTWRFKGKERNAAGKRYIATNPLGTWGEFRKAQGLPSDNVNLFYTGDLWRSIVVTNLRREGARVSVTIASTESGQKLQDVVKRYGIFFVPTPAEQQQLTRDLINDLTRKTFPWLH